MIRSCFLVFFAAILALPSFAQKFPFSGIWAGELDLYFMEKDSNARVFMRLEVIPLRSDTSVFRIIYAKEKEVKNADIRNYLVYPQQKKNNYTIDENNGILLDARFADSTLTSVYEVENNVIHISYQFRDNKVFFEVLSYSASPTGQTGGENSIPVVKNFRITNRQRGVLHKMK